MAVVDAASVVGRLLPKLRREKKALNGGCPDNGNVWCTGVGGGSVRPN